jgi:hypothetical protein
LLGGVAVKSHETGGQDGAEFLEVGREVRLAGARKHGFRNRICRPNEPEKTIVSRNRAKKKVVDPNRTTPS